MLRIYCPVCNGLLRLEDGQKEAVCVNCGKPAAKMVYPDIQRDSGGRSFPGGSVF